MKKHIIFVLISAFLFSSVFYACTQEGLPEEHKNNIDLENFEADLHAVFKVISRDMPQNHSPKKLKITALFLNSALEVFPGEATEQSFKATYLTATTSRENHPQKSNTRPPLAELIDSFDDENHARVVLDSYITSDDYSDLEKQTFIILKESIRFLDANQSVLNNFFAKKRKRGSLEKTGCTWWGSWGSCATGILTQAITGGAAGCAGGAAAGSAGGPAAATAGCVVGGVIGAVAGGLTGAAESCGGCEN